ncbi:hypothetical protein DRJ22_01565 [Candidatus Woesearchaeota archaeon]|nr:MAG: hypothetical protein DRJ22_01565 [Candidatus Woesearchaeota archaeon]
MSKRAQLFSILEQMVYHAINGNASEVLELNKSYRQLEYDVYSFIHEDLRIEYDLCRTSCVMAFNDLTASNYAGLIADAKARLEKIKKSEEGN